jgi:hypothetical protein
MTNPKFFLVASLMMSAFSHMAIAAPMDDYRWKYRPVLIFAPTKQNAQFVEQKRVIAAAQGAFQDRDIVVVYVVGNRVSTQFGPRPGSSAAALRNAYSVGQGEFRAILIGKDGGVKLRSSKPFSRLRLSRVIDAMPMRRQEMRDR